jgi:hypothetical protein
VTIGYTASPDEKAVLMEDFNWAVSWDVRDYDYVKKQIDLIRHYENEDNQGKVKELLQDGLEAKYNRMLEGQYVPDTPTDPKPYQVSFKRDVLTNNGMGRLVSIIIGKVIKRFSHYASGNNASPATIGDTALLSEKARIGMSTDGYATASGTVARWGAVFLPTFPSHVVAESGVFDEGIGGLMLNRTVYQSTQRITHTIFDDFYSLSIAVYLSSI